MLSTRTIDAIDEVVYASWEGYRWCITESKAVWRMKQAFENEPFSPQRGERWRAPLPAGLQLLIRLETA